MCSISHRFFYSYEREQEEIEIFKEEYPFAFKDPYTPYLIKEEDMFDYMIDQISQRHGIPIREAGKYTELEYTKMLTFSNIDSLNEEARNKLNQ